MLATLAPGVGRSGGPLRADVLANAGIFAVFFLHGMGLSTEKLRAGVARWKLHVVVQVLTFMVFPLLWLVLRAAVGDAIPPTSCSASSTSARSPRRSPRRWR